MVYNKIAALCAEKGVTIAKLERDCNIGNGTIRKWNKPSAQPSIMTVAKIAKYFRKPLDYFVKESK